MKRGHLFDRFAEASANFVSHAPFFVGCVLLVLIWAPTIWLFSSVDTWQLIINTVTTIITFLLVALLQNSQRRGEHAIQEKLDAIADGLADLMRYVGGDHAEFAKDIKELEESVGLEEKEAG